MDETGSLHVLVFVGADPVEGAEVSVSQATGETNTYGSLHLEPPPGERTIRLRVPKRALEGVHGPGSYLVKAATVVDIVPGETVEIILTLAPDGAIAHTDLAGVGEAATRATAAERFQEAKEERQSGKVQGTVVSAQDGSEISRARIFVRGAPVEAESGTNGRFTLELPEGTYALSVIHSDFSTESIEDVEVEADALSTLQIEMAPASVTLDDFYVTAPHIQGGVAGLIAERRDSASVSDAIGREDIARMPASDAAQAAQRVVGATIVGGRFVYVRGLGGRYSNALLNGNPLPSPEPDQATVPLDLFPSQVVQSIDISKTFMPDMPANFAGGSVGITTRSVPEEPVVALSLSSAWNSQATFKTATDHEGSSTDWLGFDDGRRALPEAIPDDYQLTVGIDKPDGDILLQEEINEKYGSLLNTPVAVEDTTVPPNMSGNLIVGNGWELGDESRVGVLASLIYRRNFTRRDELVRDFLATEEGDGIEVRNEFDLENYVDAVRWGAFVTSSLELSEDHKITLTGMRSQLSDKTTRTYDGVYTNADTYAVNTRLSFVARNLTTGQLKGEHTFSFLNEPSLEWAAFASRAARDQLDTRDIVYVKPFNQENYTYGDGSNAGRHFWGVQTESAYGVSLDWTQPLTEGFATTELKLGTLLSFKDRQFNARRFSFQKDGSTQPEFVCGPEYDPRCAEDIFVDENIGPVLDLQEFTQGGDSYDAVLDVHAGYLMGEVSLGEHWRVIGGTRVEATHQTITPVDAASGEVIDTGNVSPAQVNQVDVLPAGSVVFSPVDDTNIRLAVSRTLARPELREIAPFSFNDYFGGFPTTGNPDLKLTSILNGDLRLEYFPSPREVLAVSGFAKRFTNPIEPILLPGTESYSLSYTNAEGAVLYGVELEMRKSLGFISDVLDDFAVIANFMYAQSQIEVEQTGNFTLTNTERPMVFQSPYVVNLALDYLDDAGTQFRVLYNVSGPRIVQIGTEGVEDAYLQPQHIVDITASQLIGEHVKVSLSIENLLNAEYLVTQSRDETETNAMRRYREGVELSLGATVAY